MILKKDTSMEAAWVFHHLIQGLTGPVRCHVDGGWMGKGWIEEWQVDGWRRNKWMILRWVEG